MGITWLAMAHAKSVQRPVAAALPLTGCHPASRRRRGSHILRTIRRTWLV